MVVDMLEYGSTDGTRVGSLNLGCSVKLLARQGVSRCTTRLANAGPDLLYLARSFGVLQRRLDAVRAARPIFGQHLIDGTVVLTEREVL